MTRTERTPVTTTVADREPKRPFRVSREEAVAVALEVEMRTRKGEPIPSWMRQVAAAI